MERDYRGCEVSLHSKESYLPIEEETDEGNGLRGHRIFMKQLYYYYAVSFQSYSCTSDPSAENCIHIDGSAGTVSGPYMTSQEAWRNVIHPDSMMCQIPFVIRFKKPVCLTELGRRIDYELYDVVKEWAGPDG